MSGSPDGISEGVMEIFWKRKVKLLNYQLKRCHSIDSKNFPSLFLSVEFFYLVFIQNQRAHDDFFWIAESFCFFSVKILRMRILKYFYFEIQKKFNIRKRSKAAKEIQKLILVYSFFQINLRNPAFFGTWRNWRENR